MTEVIPLPSGKPFPDKWVDSVPSSGEEASDVVQEITAAFCRESGWGLSHAMGRALRLLTIESGAKRALVFLKNEGSSDDLFFEWSASDDVGESFKGRAEDAFSAFFSVMTRDEILVVGHPMDVARLRPEQRQWIGEQGFRSFVALPFGDEGKGRWGLCLLGGEGEAFFWPERVLESLLRKVRGVFLGGMKQILRELEGLGHEKLSTRLLNATTDSAVLMDSTGTILSMNAAFARKLKITAEHAKGKRLYDLLTPQVRKLLKEQVAHAIRRGKRILFEEDQGGVIYSHVIYPIVNSMGEIDTIALYSQNITPLKNVEKRVRDLTAELVVAQENERKRIAYDLHDGVAQELASLKIRFETLTQGLRKDPEGFDKMVGDCASIIKRSIATVRKTAHELHWPNTFDRCIEEIISNHCDDFSQETGIDVSFFSAGMGRVSLGEHQRQHIQRIVQEALNNVRKHAESTQVQVKLTAAGNTVILRVKDNGRGFCVETAMVEGERERRMGLSGMRNRTEIMGGEMRIESVVQKGTLISCEIPVTVSEEDSLYYPLF